MKITERDRMEKVQILTNKVIKKIYLSHLIKILFMISLIQYVREINNKKRI
jgi:hypothetical protein